MKTSFISTVYNEEKTITHFLDSLKKQTRLPNEVILVDGGSSDMTLEKLKMFAKKNKSLPIYVFQKKGNRSVGRNYAIKKAKGEIIACSDAGCILDKEWIKQITAPFRKKGTRVVAGYYYPFATSIFQKCLATYTCVMPNRVNPITFLPSSRSVAFTKEIWKKAKGYPEWLSTCEDLVFAQSLKKISFPFTFEKRAFVYWPQRQHIGHAFIQFFNYAIGDGMAFFIRPTVIGLYTRYIAGLIVVCILIQYNIFFTLLFIIITMFIYCLWSIIKNFKYIHKKEAFFYLPLLQITSDVAVLSGTSIGLINRLLIKKRIDR